jgi:hypothetical protein
MWSPLPLGGGTVLAVPRIRVLVRWSAAWFRATIEEVVAKVVAAEDERRQSYARRE